MTERTAPVSAVMPAYNAEPFIKEAIESVRAQTLPVAELIVVADGSTDRTVEIAESMGVQVFNQRNLGLAAARNRCIRESTQPWLLSTAMISGSRRRSSAKWRSYLPIPMLPWSPVTTAYLIAPELFQSRYSIDTAKPTRRNPKDHARGARLSIS